ncbi:hypothetical protein SFRURICE_007447 [Spodoptera frugiperda]|nr:hypothetical protein SFRURICE_007447 [Spodoptera frugiperda]
MAKRHTFPAYSIRRSKPSIRAVSQPLISMASVASSTSKTPSRMHCNDWEKFMKKASNYVCTMSALNGNYVAVIAIIVVVILSLLLPDITQKFHATHELKNMKKVLAKMSSTEKLQNLSVCANYCMRTTQSEPITIEKKIGFLRRFFFPNPNTSHKEIAIMSYVYTDSFDAKQQDEEEEVM